jgi:predicted transcriptional regulator
MKKLVQQRTLQEQVQSYRLQVQETSQAKKHLQSELADLQDHVKAEIAAKNEEASQYRSRLAV